MKAILEFNLPEDEEEHQASFYGMQWKSVVWEFDEYLRTEIKYANKEEYQELRDKLHHELEYRGLRLYE